DRAAFLGRGRTPAAPAALDPQARLGGGVGAVLDPVFSLRRGVRLEPGGSATVTFVTAIAGSRGAALGLAGRYRHLQAVSRAFDMSWTQRRVELLHLNMSGESFHLYQRLAGHLIYAGPTFRAPAELIRANVGGPTGLWRFGISGDLPILLA